MAPRKLKLGPWQELNPPALSLWPQMRAVCNTFDKAWLRRVISWKQTRQRVRAQAKLRLWALTRVSKNRASRHRLGF